MDILKRNRRELAGYAQHSGDRVVAAQGILLRLSPEAFVAIYGKVTGR